MPLVCWRVSSARGSRELGQALTGAALSGVLLCGALSPTDFFVPVPRPQDVHRC